MKRLLYIPLAFALMSVSCVKEADGGTGESIPMRIMPHISGETKGSLNTETLEGFYLQVITSDPGFSYLEHITKGGDGWSASQTLYWKNDTEPVTYAAAVFCDQVFTKDEFEGGVDLTLLNNQRTQEWINAADLLTVPSATIKCEDTSDGVLPLTFSHALSKMDFTISLGEEFYNNGYSNAVNPISSVFVKGTDLGFHFIPATGEVTVISGTAEAIKPFPMSFTPGTDSDRIAKADYEVILVPQTIAPGNLVITFSVCEINYSWSNPEEITLNPGQTSTLSISITDAPAPSNHINGHRYIEMGDGLKWATCNLGATNPYYYGELYWLGATDPADYTPWRHNVDYDVFNYMTRCASSYQAGDTLRPEDDAATSNWGAPWRMPTKEEWEVLCDRGKFNWESNNLHGVSGYFVVSKIPGYEGNTIFLPSQNKYTCFLGTASGWMYLTSTVSDPQRMVCGHTSSTGTFLKEVNIITRPVAD